MTEARRFAARPAAVDERAPESDFADSRTCSTLSVSTTSMSPSAGSSVSVPSRPGSRISGFCSSTSGCGVPDLILPCAETVLDAPVCEKVAVSDDCCAPAGSASPEVAGAPPGDVDPFREPAVSSPAEVSNDVVGGVSDPVEAEESGSAPVSAAATPPPVANLMLRTPRRQPRLPGANVRRVADPA